MERRDSGRSNRPGGPMRAQRIHTDLGLIVEVPSVIADNGMETLISFSAVSSILYQLLTSKRCWI